MKYTIIADSGVDLYSNEIKSEKVNLITVPLSIELEGVDYIDDENLNLTDFLLKMKQNKNKPKTSCPSPDAFKQAMLNGEDNIFVILISSQLSGTVNSAALAAKEVMAANPKKRIFIIDSLSAVAGETIILYKLVDLIENTNLSYEEICKKISEIRDNTRVRFILDNTSNLVKAGRMSKLVGVVSKLMVIKLVLGDDGKGEIKVCSKHIGTKPATNALIRELDGKAERDGKDALVLIHHCENEEGAFQIKNLLKQAYGLTNIIIHAMRGLSSFYANIKGLLIAF